MDGETNNFVGVYVMQADEPVVAIPCTGTVISNWDALLER